MLCDKCKQQVMVITTLKLRVCGCGTKKASKEILEYVEECNA